MQSRWMAEIEQIARNRWQATEPPPPRRNRGSEVVWRQVSEILTRHWPEPDTTELSALPASTSYRLFDAVGRPIACHICSRCDRWIIEIDGDQQLIRLFVCEHEPLRIGIGIIRQVSTVSLHRVARCEAVSIPG